MSGLLGGLNQVLAGYPLLIITLGSLGGIIGGFLPGISSAAAIALALPLTFGMDPTISIILLTSIYTGAAYGGSISATLINTPGTPEAAVMTFDGYAMTRKGQAGKALWIALISGTVGGIIGTIVLIAASVPLAKEALSFGPAEYTGLAIFGLTALAMLTEGRLVKGAIAAIFGVMVALIGIDPISGTQRMTLGTTSLIGGIPLIPLLIGLFAVSEAFILLTQQTKPPAAGEMRPRFWRSGLTWRELRRQGKFMLLGTGIGTFVGVKPGGGATVASLIAYSAAKSVSKEGDNFGNGQLEGLTTPEAADKATVGAALIPTLTLGIPASASTAVLIGGFTIHNIQPGPNLFHEQSGLVYAIFVSLLVANVAVFLLGLAILPLLARMITIPKPVLGAVVLFLTMVGAYASETNMEAMYIAFGFGVIGYALRRLDFPIAPVILGTVLAPILEVNGRQSLLLSRGSYSIFVDRPITLGLLIVSAFLVAIPVYLSVRRRPRKAAAAETDNRSGGPKRPRR